VASDRPPAWSASVRTPLAASACSPAATPANSTTSWWAFPPSTTKVQLDEKWSFVAKKEKHCDPQDEGYLSQGDQWDHIAFDPDSRLVLSVVVGKRTTGSAVLLLEDVRERLGGRVPELVTSDEYAAYREALLAVFGQEVVPPRTGKRGRPAGPRLVPPQGLCHATVRKTRAKGRVVAVESRVVLGELPAGAGVSTSYLERHNATDRHRNARKGRKTYRFSKDWAIHAAVTAFTMYSYNFCWPVRTLRERGHEDRWRQRTPGMVAGLTDHVWSLEEWLTLPGIQR
jgi:IS1 family transposase